MDAIGLFVLRAVTGGYIVFYGLPKLHRNNAKYVKEFEGLGFHPGDVFVKRSGVVETASGALIALGALGPIGPVLLLADMIVASAAETARAKKFDVNEREEELLFASIAVLLALSGPGQLSLDRALGIKFFDRPWLRYLSLGAAFAGAAFMLSART
ncbi:MAG: DoxX family protein [Candidatus Aquilonibacter sp.]